jgi:hypothetical protein
MFTLAMCTKPVIPGHGKAHEITYSKKQNLKNFPAASRANILRMTQQKQ